MAIEVLWCNPQTGEFLRLRIEAGSEQTIPWPHGYQTGGVGFVVSAVAGPNGVAGGVAFGTFNQWHDGCNNGCRPSYQDLRQVNFGWQAGNVWRNGPAYVYDCGCNDRVFYRDHYYDRVWVNGTQEVLGNWVEQPNQPRYFQPVYQKPTPISTSYESYDCQCGVNPTASETDLPGGNKLPFIVGGGCLVVAAFMVWWFFLRRKPA